MKTESKLAVLNLINNLIPEDYDLSDLESDGLIALAEEVNSDMFVHLEVHKYSNGQEAHYYNLPKDYYDMLSVLDEKIMVIEGKPYSKNEIRTLMRSSGTIGGNAYIRNEDL